MQYAVSLSVFAGQSELTHVGEINGVEGPFSVHHSNPAKLTVLVRPTR